MSKKCISHCMSFSAAKAVIRAMLKNRKYTVTTAMDGIEALKILEERKEKESYMPDIILLDVMMPKMNGFRTCAKIREMFPLSAVPIIMVSAKSREENVIQGLNCGSNDYVTKPFKKLELLARIDTQLRLAQAWQQELESEYICYFSCYKAKTKNGIRARKLNPS